ncbi:hypothetical protein VP1G_05557 [Cytospora mali]|uniref:Uncharacterized protein n=1 Tax=Cytospora mali TaxID=578113 RepID=A0A194V2X0_CYTMA|nr:hypothetical protein VP1G_05557 [Valsa mali var. pyri (nom. inval.)]
MSPTPETTPTPIPTFTNSPRSDEATSWHTVAVTFVSCFILLLLASAVGICHLNRRKASLEAVLGGLNRTRGGVPSPNPHVYGSNAWREHELAQASEISRDALRIADLEAQNSVLEQRAAVLERLADFLEQQNRHLNRENSELKLDSSNSNLAFDPVVMQRVHDEIHRPVQRTGSEPPQSLDFRNFRCSMVTTDYDPDLNSGDMPMCLIAYNRRDRRDRRDISCFGETARSVIGDRPEILP